MERISAVEFLREYVNKNVPVILTDVAVHWEAYKQWDLNYLRETLGDTRVTVSQTPNGRADAVLDLQATQYPIVDDQERRDLPKEVFTMPHDQEMPFNAFTDLLIASKTDPRSTVNYVQVG